VWDGGGAANLNLNHSHHVGSSLYVPFSVPYARVPLCTATAEDILATTKVWVSVHGVTVDLHKPCGCGLHWSNVSFDLSVVCHGEMATTKIMPAKGATTICKSAHRLAKEVTGSRAKVRTEMKAAEATEVKASNAAHAADEAELALARARVSPAPFLIRISSVVCCRAARFS